MTDSSNESLYSKLSQVDFDSLTDNEKEDYIKALEIVAAPNPDNYQPHEKQKEFHRSTKKYRLVFGANRAGKTECGAMEDVFHLTGRYPEWYPKEGRFKGPTIGRVIVTDYKSGARAFEKKLLKWLPKELILNKKTASPSGALERLEVRHISGGISVLEVLTHEQPNSVFEGWNGHWAHFDEPPPRTQWVATSRGLMDFEGRAWFTLTPLSEPWLYDRFVDTVDPSVFTITMFQSDNPHLTEKERQEFLKNLNEDEKEARLYGRFIHLVGRVYKEFDPAFHCIPQDKIKLNEGCPVYFVLDPADRRPHCGIWARVDPFGTIFIIDEICFAGDVKQLSKEILKRELMNKIVPSQVIRILDPNKGKAPEGVGGIDLVTAFANSGVFFTTNVNDDITMGHLAVSERLHFDRKNPVSFTNKPKLYFIKETTMKCVKQLQSYIWDDWNDSSRDKKQKPKDINKDFPDCVRYLCIFNPQFFTQSQEKDPEYGGVSDPEPWEGPTRFSK